MRNQGVLLLFDFSLHKLLQSKTLVGLLKGLISRRQTGRAAWCATASAKLKSLVEQDPAYRARYLKAVQTLHVIPSCGNWLPLAQAFEVRDLLLRDREFEDRRAART